MGNEQSLPKVFEHVANSGRDNVKYIKTACDLVEFGRTDLAEQLILPSIKDASLETICAFLSEKRISSEMSKKILDEYQPVEKEKLKGGKHLNTIFRHPEILDKAVLTYATLRDIFETISEKYDSPNIKTATSGGDLFDMVLGLAVGDLTRGEIMNNAYEFLSRIPPDFLTAVEDETDFTRFDLVGKTHPALGKYKDLAPLGDFARRQWEKIEGRETTKLTFIEDRNDDELYQ